MSKNTLTISVAVDTQILTTKFKAIAKHAQALAEELEQIDKDICPSCGD